MANTRERFWEKVALDPDPEACWHWLAATDKGGYGRVRLPGTNALYAHRVAYEWLIGPIPEGMSIDHLCRTRDCVNPSHLEAVTLRENIMRSPVQIMAVNARKTHCVHGHELAGENLRVRPNGGRSCWTCHRAAGRKTDAKRRAEKRRRADSMRRWV